MQIRSLVLYNNKGEKRILQFKIGKVNIITGESKTGKTALIDIINYCLCSDECRISEGIIRDTVEWFGILLQFNSEQVFVARQNPNRLNQSSTQNVYFSNSDIVNIPDLSDLHNNSDIHTMKDFFTKKLFINEYQNNPESGTRAALTVNFKHSRYYSFQPQDLIAQRNHLFYGQSDNFVAQSIKDTLPYFLGAIREDFIRIEQEIASKKRELSKHEREFKEHERLKQDGSSKIYELVDEAKQLNLLPADKSATQIHQAIDALNEVLSWELTQAEIIQGENENLKKVIDEKAELSRKLSKLNDDFGAVKSFIHQTSDYSLEATQQKRRLESIKLFSESDSELHNCPLCSQHLKTQIPSVSAINKSLSDLSNNLTNTLAEQPKLSQYLEKLSEEQANLRNAIDVKQNSIKAIYREQEHASKLKDMNLRRGKVIGKISLFLESFSIVDEDKNLKNRIELLKSQIHELELLINSDDKESRLNSVLNQINNQMTSWASRLDLEHQNSPIRFDIKKLTIFADTPTKSIPLLNMGSGANWLACHLLIHFALHKHFIKANRPVPRFIILDQPSQIYFPPEKDINQTGKISESSDEMEVRRIFEFILKVTKELCPDLQVIIADHAKLNFEEFDNSIIEEWRNGRKLVPDSWVNS